MRFVRILFLLSGFLLFLTGCTPKKSNPEIILTPDERTDLSGTVVNIEFIIEGSHYYGWVYLPEEFRESDAKQEIPLLCFLSGMRRADTVFQNFDTASLLERSFTEGNQQPFIFAALPCADYDADFENFFIRHFLPLARTKFHASNKREENALGGISSGGYLASRLFFKYPKQFSILGQHSAAIAKGDVARWEENLKKSPPTRKYAYYFDVGEQDPLIEGYTLLYPVLKRCGADFEFHTAPGSHRGDYWQEHFPEYIRWYAGKLGGKQNIL
jgi:enterochelin esterase-like enzyme